MFRKKKELQENITKTNIDILVSLLPMLFVAFFIYETTPLLVILSAVGASEAVDIIFSLIIPKQIAKTVATSKITKAFSGSRKWEYKNMQWSDKYKKWFVYFKQQDQDNYQTIQLSPKYFPISGEYKQLGEEYSKRQEVKREY